MNYQFPGLCSLSHCCPPNNTWFIYKQRQFSYQLNGSQVDLPLLESLLNPWYAGFNLDTRSFCEQSYQPPSFLASVSFTVHSLELIASVWIPCDSKYDAILWSLLDQQVTLFKIKSLVYQKILVNIGFWLDRTAMHHKIVTKSTNFKFSCTCRRAEHGQKPMISSHWFFLSCRGLDTYFLFYYRLNIEFHRWCSNSFVLW